MRSQRGIAVIGVIGLVAVVGLFVAYVSGHPLPWAKNEFKKSQPVVQQAPVVVAVEKPVVVDAEPAVAAAVTNG